MKATHIAVPMSSELGAYSWLKETGAKLGTSEGPCAGRRLAAVNCVLYSNGSPLPVGWDWAARPLEFAAPNPLVRSILRGNPAPILTIADAEMQEKTLEKDLDTNITAKDSQGNVTQPVVNRAPPIPGETPFYLDDLIARTSARVRLGKHTREPARRNLKSNPPATPISGAAQLN